MGEVINSQDAYNWSISRIADAFGKDRRTVGKRLQEVGVKPAGKRRGSPVYALSDVGPALFNEARRGTGEGINFDDFPDARKAWYQSENERLKFEERTRQLIPEDEFARELSFLAKTMAAGLDSLPDMLERDAGLSPEAIERAQVVIDGLREQMYQAAIGDSGGGVDDTYR
ncbi:Protein of unknown function [Onishia taeanensis]|uniref:Terminase small subunit n=1 Tax=Onishia taeanensis TaxID=284577 RepID=A0A1G7NF19_9GAMM|nr:DUF1441 family protein [Halomonas taeanensis]SDF72556.1 Protein of unknown function [Halomonas taeanensis]